MTGKDTRRARRTVEVRREEILTATTDLLDRIGLAAIRVGRRRRGARASARRWSSTTSAPRTRWSRTPSRTPWTATCTGSTLATAKGADPLDRLRRVLRLYGPTGAATGWRVWIDAWALAQREPVIRQVLRRLDHRWSAALLEVIEEGVADGSFTCPDPEPPWPGSRRCSTGCRSRRSSTEA